MLDDHPVFTTPPSTAAQLRTLTAAFSGDMTEARKLGKDRTLAKKISRQALLDCAGAGRAVLPGAGAA